MALISHRWSGNRLYMLAWLWSLLGTPYLLKRPNLSNRPIPQHQLTLGGSYYGFPLHSASRPQVLLIYIPPTFAKIHLISALFGQTPSTVDHLPLTPSMSALFEMGHVSFPKPDKLYVPFPVSTSPSSLSLHPLTRSVIAPHNPPSLEPWEMTRALEVPQLASPSPE